MTEAQPPDPHPGELPLAQPDLAMPAASPGECRITWVGHATFLIQLPGLNILTDPVWSKRVSPVGFIGSKRFVPAVPRLNDLPSIDVVLISHDHYDHLDRPTVVALNRRHGGDLLWLVPLGHARWFRQVGVERVVELDWWETVDLPNGFEAVSTPARHWTRRTPWGTNIRLWCGWAIHDATLDGPSVYFAGDSGFGHFFEEIGERLGPFDASLIPIGAYEPRWFMGAAHMNPEEAVKVYQQLQSGGAFVPMHWGTFRLTFEDPLEPPQRTREAWRRAGLPEHDLHVLRHGETLIL